MFIDLAHIGRCINEETLIARFSYSFSVAAGGFGLTAPLILDPFTTVAVN